jgi:hypothetical protein
MVTMDKLYITMLKPVLVYESESWILTARDEQKLRTFERKLLRKMSGPSRVNE